MPSAASAGTITTVAQSPVWSVSPTSDGGFLLADEHDLIVKKVSPTGDVSTVAGDGDGTECSTPVECGDGGPATAAPLDPTGVAALPGGGFLVADSHNGRVRMVSSGGTINTVAGGGDSDLSCAYGSSPPPGDPFTSCGNGGPATQAYLGNPHGVAALPGGGFIFAAQSWIVEVSSGGTIDVVAGDGSDGFRGDNGPATSASLSDPENAAPTADGGFLISDAGNDRVRKVAADGTITTVAGNGGSNCPDPTCGDGGPATAAPITAYWVAPTSDGGFLFADGLSGRIRRVAPDGTMSTVAGSQGAQAVSGDNGPAIAAGVPYPTSVAPTSDGGFLIGEGTPYDVVRRVSAAGEVAILGGPSGTVKDSSGAFGFGVIDSADPTPECSLDGSGFAPCSSPYSFGPLADGPHTFEVRDHPDGSAAGPVSERDWTIDTTPPKVFIDNAPSGSGNPPDAAITFHADDPNATFVCTLDGGAPFGCVSPYEVSGLADGQHTFSVSATDAVGNQSTPVDAMWVVGGTCPAMAAAERAHSSAAGCPVPVVSNCPTGTVNKGTLGSVIVALAGNADGCFKVDRNGVPTFTSTGVVVLNGVQVTPSPGTSIVLDGPSDSVRFTGPVTLGAVSPLTFTIPVASSWQVTQLAGAAKLVAPSLAAVQDALVEQRGWPLPLVATPTFEVSGDNGGQMKIGVTLAMPYSVGALKGPSPSPTYFLTARKNKVFVNPGESKTFDGGIVVGLGVTASNDNGVSFQGKVEVQQAYLFGLAELSKVSLAIDTSTSPPTFEGAATFSLAPPFSTSLEEPPDVSLALQLGPCGIIGPLRKVSAAIDHIGVQLAYGVYLQRLSAEFGGTRMPTAGGTECPDYAPTTRLVQIAGGVGVSYGPAVDLSPLFKGEAFSLDGRIAYTLPYPWNPKLVKIELTGEGKIVGVPVASSKLTITGDGTITLGGNLDLSIKGVGFVGGIADTTFIDLRGGTFNVEAAGKLNLLLYSYGGQALLSNKGYIACGDFTFLGTHARLGFSVDKQHGVQILDEDTCDLGKYRVMPATDAREAAVQRTFYVAPHSPATVVQVDGLGGAPGITLISPTGAEIHADGTQPVRSANVLSLADPAGSRRFFVLANPTAGTWTLKADSGATLTGLRVAATLPPVKIRASVSRAGAARVLAWHLNRIPGQSVTFVAIGGPNPAQLVTSTSSTGRVRFTPQIGGSTVRSIVALVDQDGRPRTHMIVARFRVPPPAPPQRVRGIRVAHGNLEWTPQASASQYLVEITTNVTGLSYSTKHAQIRLPPRIAKSTLTVTITALGPTGLAGPQTIVKIPAHGTKPRPPRHRHAPNGHRQAPWAIRLRSELWTALDHLT